MFNKRDYSWLWLRRKFLEVPEEQLKLVFNTRFQAYYKFFELLKTKFQTVQGTCMCVYNTVYSTCWLLAREKDRSYQQQLHCEQIFFNCISIVFPNSFISLYYLLYFSFNFLLYLFPTLMSSDSIFWLFITSMVTS